MPTSYLWPNIDNFLKTHILTDLGPLSSTYSTLKLAEVTVGPMLEPAQATTPSLLIQCFECYPSFMSHGDGTVKWANRYPYTLIVYDKVQDTTTAGPPAVDSYATLKANMQEHLRRLVEWLAGHPLLGGVTASSDGEFITHMTFPPGGAAIEIWGPEAGYFWGGAGIEFVLDTET